MIKLLDCTLRDGGYVNDWNFGKSNIKNITSALEKANIDIIESGILINSSYNLNYDIVKYHSFSEIKMDSKKYYALMLILESYNIDELPDCSFPNAIIRLSFHKKDLKKAIEYAKIIKKKGYKLFLQPTATLFYSENELIELINISNNEIIPDSIAIVDTFGQMMKQDVLKLSKIFDKYVNETTYISFHSHNNLQNSFSNACEFLDYMHKKSRNIIVDSSLLGMGRGAGNLCTELISNYLNLKYESSYKIDPIIEVIDNVIYPMKKEHEWGYCLAYYLSAIYGCHPNYSIRLLKHYSLNSSDIKNILSMILDEKKLEFDCVYLDKLYHMYSQKKFI